MRAPINNISPLPAKRLTFLAEIPHGVTLEDILRPEYWANVAKKISAHKTHIEADWEDGTRLVILRVVGVGENYAKVRVIEDYSFVDPVPAVQAVASVSAVASPSGETEEGFEVAYKTHHHKWSVIRKADKLYMKDQCESEAEAREWLKKYLAGEVKSEAKAA